MAFKFNVYYKTDLSEPWILANETPIAFDALGNEYTVSNLESSTHYYFTIVGGDETNGIFTPYFTQAIGPSAQDITDIDSAQVLTVRSKTLSS